MKLKPKAVEVSMSSGKPEGLLGESDDEHEENMSHDPSSEDQDKDSDDLSPEDISLLEQLLHDDKEHS